MKLLNTSGRQKSMMKTASQSYLKMLVRSTGYRRIKESCFQKERTEVVDSFFPVSVQTAALSASPGKQHISHMENLKRCRTKLQSSNDEQTWCLVSHLLLKDPCLIAPLCQSRSLTVLKLTVANGFQEGCKKTDNKISAEPDEILCDSSFCHKPEIQTRFVQKCFQCSPRQMLTLHSFFNETHNIWTCLCTD